MKIDPGANDQQDRVQVLDDEKKRALDLYSMRLVPPTDVLIFDEPTRCYRINKQWAAYVMGMVSWLAETAPWRDAQDESYFAIEEIQKFLAGVECMAFGLRQKPDDSCIMQQTLDGVTWTDVFDFSLCLDVQLGSINQYLTVNYQQNLTDSGFVPSTSTPSDYYTPEQLQDLSVQADVCDTAGKDAVYGAVNQLVRYIHGVNVDFLQELSQAANVPQQVERFVAAVPGVGLLPFDELIGYTAFIVDELLAEYNATADETLLQTIICDLFCIAVASDCHLDFNDVYNYFAGKVSPTFSNVSTTLLNLVQFATTGTFSGDDYFYFLCYFQLVVAGLKQKFLSIQSIETYAMQVAAGFNSPDNDWSIFCIECPTLYRRKIWDFTQSSDGAEISTGELVVLGEYVPGQGWKVTGDETNGILTLGLHIEPSWQIIAVALKFANKSEGDGNLNSIRLRENFGIANPSVGLAMDWGWTGWTYYTSIFPTSGYAELFIRYDDLIADNAYLSHIGLIFEPDNAPIDAAVTEDSTFSPSVFP